MPRALHPLPRSRLPHSSDRWTPCQASCAGAQGSAADPGCARSAPCVGWSISAVLGARTRATLPGGPGCVLGMVTGAEPLKFDCVQIAIGSRVFREV